MKNWIICFIIAVGLAIRLWRIDIPILEFYPTRQVQTAEITRNIYREGFKLFTPSVHYYGPGKGLYLLEFPIYNAMVALVYMIAKMPLEIYGRLISLTGWIVACFFIYNIAKKLTSEFVAVSSLFLYVFSPLSVLVSRSFQPDQWMLTFSLGAIYFLHKWAVRHNPSFFFFSCIFASLATLTKIPAAFFTFLPIFIVVTNRKALKLKLLFLIMICIAIPIAWYLYAAFAYKDPSFNGAYTADNWFDLKLFLLPKYYMTLFGNLYNLALLPLGLFFLMVGLVTRLSKKQYLLIYWLFGVLVYSLVFNIHNATHEYYNLPLIPIASIFAGLGLERFSKSLRGLFINRAAILSLVALFYFISAMVVIKQRGYEVVPRFSSVLETANNIQAMTSRNELIIGSMDAGPTLVYYSDRFGWGFDVSQPKSVEKLEKLKSEGAVLFASANKQQLQTNKLLTDYLYSNYQEISNSENYAIFNLTSERPF